MNKKTLSYAIVISLWGVSFNSFAANEGIVENAVDAQAISYKTPSDVEPVMVEDTAKLQEGEGIVGEDEAPKVRLVQKVSTKVQAVDPTELPIRIDADKLYYNDTTGRVWAYGAVEAMQGPKELYTPEIEGNAKTQMYYAKGGYHYLEEKGKLRDIKGEELQYNAATGEIVADQSFGFLSPYWVKAESVSYDSEKGNITKGWVTTKHAIAFKGVPDYRLEGDHIEVYPNDKMIVHNAKVFVKNAKVLSMKKYVTSLKRKDGIGLIDFLPRPAYNSTDGFGLKGRVVYPLGENTNAYFNYTYFGNTGFKPSVGIRHYLPWGTATLGYNRESAKLNAKPVWIEKSPELSVDTHVYRLGNSPITVRGGASVGYWKEAHLRGNHWKLFGEVSHAPFKISNKGTVKLYAGYQKDYYGYNQHTRNLPYWGVHSSFNLNSRLKAWIGYRHHNLERRDESPYPFDRIDVRQNLYYGVSVKATRLDTFSVNVQRDMEAQKNRYVDITWHRDMHSFTGSLTYRTLHKRWEYMIKAKDF